MMKFLKEGHLEPTEQRRNLRMDTANPKNQKKNYWRIKFLVSLLLKNTHLAEMEFSKMLEKKEQGDFIFRNFTSLKQ